MSRWSGSKVRLHQPRNWAEGGMTACALQNPFWGYEHAVATTPAQRLGVFFALLTHPYQPSPKGLSGRPAHCPFRGLLSVHSRYACTLALSPIRDTHFEGFSYFVTSIAAPAASGWSDCRVGLAPTGKRRLVTAHTQLRRS
jgi:hypothetical protein